MQTSDIRTAPCPSCILCGSAGRPIYTAQEDRLFKAPGSWNFTICSNRQCRLIWLDPMPVTEDLGKAYVDYYTHHGAIGADRVGPLKRIYQLMERGYWAGRYDYPVAGSMLVKALGKLLYLFPLRRRGADGCVRYLKAVPHGRLLDVGSGSGDWLLFMRELGWQVEGIDFDDRAVKIAIERGLAVRCGALEQQSFPDSSFDAVVLNHVIEHVPDPVGTLVESARILRSGGKLVIFTPNGSSLGHKVFKNNWRGLEPPRHLHLFSMESMYRILKQAGFREISIRPHIARSVIHESVLLYLRQAGFAPASGRNCLAGLAARLFNVLELCLLHCKPSVSDCVAAVAVR
jgi:SAM-dependent methyltransferase